MKEDCPNYTCRDCAYLKRSGVEVSCPCFDHNKIEHCAPYFVRAREENGFPCRFFKPSSIHVWDLQNYWTDYETWLKDWAEVWRNGKDIRDYTLPWFNIKGDEDIDYAVRWEDYLNGTMIVNGKLKAIKKRYLKRSKKSATGYEIITEECEEIEL